MINVSHITLVLFWKEYCHAIFLNVVQYNFRGLYFSRGRLLLNSIASVVCTVILNTSNSCLRETVSTFRFWSTATSYSSPYAAGPLSCLSCLSVCNVGVLWSNGWMDQDATWYEGKPRPRRHCVRLCQMGTQFLPTERGTAVTHFSAHFALTQPPISKTLVKLQYFTR